MIVILKPDMGEKNPEYRQILDVLAHKPNIKTRVHQEIGAQQTLTEIYLIGDTASLDKTEIESLPGVERVVRISEEYRVLGRHRDDRRPTGFEYNGVKFNQDNLNVFAGLCAVDNPEHVEMMLKALRDNGQVCTRMGAYKPRTNPYSFQGHGKDCLPWVFELAGRYGIKVIAMEITHDSHLVEIQESLNAAEYLASEGNRNIVFGLRGMKTNMGDPHRNFVDFAHVPVVKRLTRMPVCIDPSHSVGTRDRAPDGMLDISHVTAQGVIAGANMILVDFHPVPTKALVDGPQALLLEELPYFLEDVAIAREAYEKRRALTQRFRKKEK
jgi:3-deoxy-7-phosphoheptulonate synthase